MNKKFSSCNETIKSFSSSENSLLRCSPSIIKIILDCRGIIKNLSLDDCYFLSNRVDTFKIEMKNDFATIAALQSIRLLFRIVQSAHFQWASEQRIITSAIVVVNLWKQRRIKKWNACPAEDKLAFLLETLAKAILQNAIYFRSLLFKVWFVTREREGTGRSSLPLASCLLNETRALAKVVNWDEI